MQCFDKHIYCRKWIDLNVLVRTIVISDNGNANFTFFAAYFRTNSVLKLIRFRKYK